ncbi:sensor histidine kinase [Exiguobacterium artemiae]|uniref:sensor histidine kinase n=1 Tax=Exiguobacterium artemiae TaxID=340145 RepID=UPI002964FFE9|nr:PAS domain-containing sensor histidine kinase [Exiguobacterium sibiricum]MDW2884681.1 PAS domain-containing sensor histidine kinase [Exiguobacterium sibiricum]
MEIDQLGQQIFQVIQDGIIVMDQKRNIVALNPSAEKLTGWRLGGLVPYCSFCQHRQIPSGQERCYLVTHEQSPYFSSEMPTYSGELVDVEMSTAKILYDNQTGATYYLLVLRDFSERKKQQEHEMRQQMVQQLIAAREEEHKRLAMELHDGVGQSLFGLSLALDSLKTDTVDPKTTAYLNEVSSEMKRVMSDLRLYSKQLRPLELDQFGLEVALDSLLDGFRKQKPNIQFKAEYILRTIRLKATIEINLYRIVQESVMNSLKHADPTRIVIRLIESNEYLLLVIQDNGAGFDVKHHQSGLGLQHIQERASAIGATADVTSDKRQGTSIRIKLNLKEVFE